MSIAAKALSMEAKSLSHEKPVPCYPDESFMRSFRPGGICLR